MSRIAPGVDFLDADPLATAARLHALADDLRHLASGRRPRIELMHAPELHRWGMMTRPSLVLTGAVSGHPLIDEGHPAVTSELFAIDVERKWARTLSRFYRLVPRHEETVNG